MKADALTRRKCSLPTQPLSQILPVRLYSDPHSMHFSKPQSPSRISFIFTFRKPFPSQNSSTANRKNVAYLRPLYSRLLPNSTFYIAHPLRVCLHPCIDEALKYLFVEYSFSMDCLRTLKRVIRMRLSMSWTGCWMAVWQRGGEGRAVSYR